MSNVKTINQLWLKVLVLLWCMLMPMSISYHSLLKNLRRERSRKKKTITAAESKQNQTFLAFLPQIANLCLASAMSRISQLRKLFWHMPSLLAVCLLGLKVKAFNHLKQEATEPNTVTLLSMIWVTNVSHSNMENSLYL